MNYPRLRFRRQFLLTPQRLEAGGIFLRESRFAEGFLYVHQDLGLKILQGGPWISELALLGFILDPSNPGRDEEAILADMIGACRQPEDVARYLHGLSGRFALLLQTAQGLIVFHDACGLRPVYYRRMGEALALGSSAAILGLASPLVPGDRFRAFMTSDYVRKKREHWLLCGCSLYEDVGQLLPNHYLRGSDLLQTRYWPDRHVAPRPSAEVASEACGMLAASLQAVARRFGLALPLTAGLDSRTLLAAVRAIAPSVFFYTLRYRKLDRRSPDIRVPARLLRRLGLRHHVIDCTAEPSPEFSRIYEANTSPHHMDDWGKIAFGMLRGLPEGKLAIKGNCSEISRCYLYSSGRHPDRVEPDDIIRLYPGWEGLDFLQPILRDWLAGATKAAERSAINTLDLFYWEMRQGGWQAQSQSEWDIAQEVYTPFNNRKLLELMLSAPIRDRIKPDYLLYRHIIRQLWPELLAEPFNPPRKASVFSRIMTKLKHALHR